MHGAILTHPDAADPIALVTGASTTVNLKLRTQNAIQSLVFFSKKMNTVPQK